MFYILLINYYTNLLKGKWLTFNLKLAGLAGLAEKSQVKWQGLRWLVMVRTAGLANIPFPNGKENGKYAL